MANSIEAVLFDSGRVLNIPVTGHWFITPNFFDYVDEDKFKSIDLKIRYNAFKKAGEYINAQSLIVNEEEEYYHFLEYYNIFARELPQLELEDVQIRAITKDLVCNYDKYSFYEDGLRLIPELSKKYKLAVVSDAWPSLENVFKKAGLRDYFSSFVISSKKGIIKPHELMYKAALEELGVSAENAIFIDDSMENCTGARKLGIQTYTLCRDWRLYLYSSIMYRDCCVIRSLKGIGKMLL